MNLFAIAKSTLAAISEPTRSERGSTHHARDNFSAVLDTKQRSKSGNTARKFFSAVDRVDDQSCSVAGAGSFHVAAAQCLAQNIESQSAGGYFCTRHFFDAAIGLGHRGAIALAVHAHFHSAKISHGDDVALPHDRIEQRAVFFAISHHFSVGAQPYAKPAASLTLPI